MGELITVFTDASFFPHKKVAGWGGWAKGDFMLQAVWGSGPLPVHNNPGLLELEAMAYFLGNLKTNPDVQLTKHTSIMMQSDSLSALATVLGYLPQSKESRHPDGAPINNHGVIGKSQRVTDAVESIQESLKNMQGVWLRHVRGHTGSKGRQWVNKRCDELARSAALRVFRPVF